MHDTIETLLLLSSFGNGKKVVTNSVAAFMAISSGIFFTFLLIILKFVDQNSQLISGQDIFITQRLTRNAKPL